MVKTGMRWLCVLCVLVMIGGVCRGQDKKDEAAVSSAPNDGRHYQVVFVAQELEGGKVINSRRYETDMTLQGPGSGTGSIRTGSKIPLATGSYSGAQSQAQTQFTYIDVGRQFRLQSRTVWREIASSFLLRRRSAAREPNPSSVGCTNRLFGRISGARV